MFGDACATRRLLPLVSGLSLSQLCDGPPTSRPPPLWQVDAPQLQPVRDVMRIAANGPKRIARRQPVFDPPLDRAHADTQRSGDGLFAKQILLVAGGPCPFRHRSIFAGPNIWPSQPVDMPEAESLDLTRTDLAPDRVWAQSVVLGNFFNRQHFFLLKLV